MDKKAWFIVSLCVAGLLGWWFWQQKQIAAYRAANPQVVTAPADASAGGVAAPSTGATAGNNALNSSNGAGNANTAEGINTAAAIPAAEEKTVILQNEDAIFTLSTKGGGISTAELLKHRRAVDSEDNVFMNLAGPAPIGALGAGGADLHSGDFELVSSTPTSAVFRGPAPNGLQATKTFSLADGPDGHLVKLELNLVNPSSAPVEIGAQFLYTGASVPLQKGGWIHPAFCWNDEGDTGKKDINAFKSGGLGKLLGGGSKPPKTEIQHGFEELRWGGTTNQFFTSIVSPIPPEGKAGGWPGTAWSRRFAFTDPHDAENTGFGIHGGISLPEMAIQPGNQVTLDYEIYTGPKIYGNLKEHGRERKGAMFYGFFTPISAFLNKILTLFHGWVGNWGIAIIMMTLLIRLAIWPLHARSTRTMKRMSLLTPKMTEIKEKYADEPQRMNVEMMKLYKTYGVNPMAGCLPVFLQLPIFLGFFRMLQHTAELRGQPFFGWVKDLSMPDTIAEIGGFPINILPIIMGLSMFVQMSMTPKSGDKTQQMMLKLMPLIFMVFCYNYASALALYWTGSNLFSIFQTWLMKFQPDPVLEAKEPPSAPPAGGGNPGGGGGGLFGAFGGMGGMGGGGGGGNAGGAAPKQLKDKSQKKSGPRTGGGKLKR